jgi:hypothetical protein
MASRAELIAELKRQGVRGKLSKMKKHELQALLHGGGGASRLTLEDEAPNAKPAAARKPSAYHTFVKENLQRHGGDMSAVAAAYRQQSGKGMRDIGKATGKAIGRAAVGLTEGLVDAAKETIRYCIRYSVYWYTGTLSRFKYRSTIFFLFHSVYQQFLLISQV